MSVDLQALIASYTAEQESRIKSIQEKIAEIPAKLAATKEKFDALVAAGVITDYSEWSIKYGTTVHVEDTRHWGKIHKIFGKLTKYNVEPVSNDGRKREVIVTLIAEKDHCNVTFKFRKKLPKGAKCKFVTEVCKSRRLVCE